MVALCVEHYRILLFVIVWTLCQDMGMKARRSVEQEVEAMVFPTEVTEVRTAAAAGAVAVCLVVVEQAGLIVVLTVEAEVVQEEEEAWGKCLKSAWFLFDHDYRRGPRQF